ncbi:hypothetical protein B7R78_0021875 [Ralstonia solanacearum]|uniref:hypothetical protein n=1 Tax=Ralstonia solanacearum TaxID=305 RepID=UPI0011426134|nr:hypothetical protein [Ralstonia solanacearum]MBT1539628.1 hypothetical protein [Ralstonia solanacearum]
MRVAIGPFRGIPFAGLRCCSFVANDLKQKGQLMGKTTSKFSPEIELFIERYVAELCSGTAAVFAGPGYPMAAVAELGRLARYWACPRRRSGSYMSAMTASGDVGVSAPAVRQ